MTAVARGVIYIHSATAALCPHIEWAIGRVLGAPTHLRWAPQPADPATRRADYSWAGAAGSGAALASALRQCSRLRFEVTEDATADQLGQRYAFTPRLGLFHASTAPNGDLVIGEDRLKAAVVGETLGVQNLSDAIASLLGADWDDELEPFRQGGDDASVRWLYRAG